MSKMLTEGITKGNSKGPPTRPKPKVKVPSQKSSLYHGHRDIERTDSILEHITNLEFEIKKLRKRIKKLENEEGRKNVKDNRGE